MTRNTVTLHASEDRALIELVKRLVRCESHPGVSRQEEAVALELASYLGSRGITPTLTEVEPGRPNLLATIQGPKSGPHLLFCGHTDTVGPYEADADALFTPVEREGRLYGRGAVDMKGPLGAMAAALAWLHQGGRLEAGRVSLAAIVDEEMQSLGAEALIRSGFSADAAIVGEPTANHVSIGNKGLEWLRVDFEGRTAHGGAPEAGVNAIAAAAHFIQLVEQDLVPAFASRRDPVLGLPAINMGTIAGGDQPSTIAGHCAVALDRRWVTTETIDDVFEDLERLLAKVRAARPGLRTDISRVPGGMATMIHGPVTIEAAHPVVAAAQQALNLHGRCGLPVTVFPAWTDASLLSREGNIPSIIWGPGTLDSAHTAGEYIETAELLLAARLYASAALNFTGHR
jgi:acetylornithine deacetylase/succinyl-diaminopimelate desuccinylase family protein